MEYVGVCSELNADHSVVKSYSKYRELAQPRTKVYLNLPMQQMTYERATNKRNADMDKVSGKEDNDLESFMHLGGPSKKKENELKQMMIYLYAYLHSDWVKYQRS